MANKKESKEMTPQEYFEHIAKKQGFNSYSEYSLACEVSKLRACENFVKEKFNVEVTQVMDIHFLEIGELCDKFQILLNENALDSYSRVLLAPYYEIKFN